VLFRLCAPPLCCRRARRGARATAAACTSLCSPRSGLDNAGKTTVLKKFNGEDISTISPTLGFAISSLEYNGYLLNCWDVGGQRTIRAYWRNYFEATDGLIWVVDSADRRRLADCRAELRALLGAEKLAGASLLVLANKQDMRGALPAADIAAALGLGAAAADGAPDRRHWAIHACSAVSGDGLVEGLDWLVADVAQRIFTGED
jgi:ADP-ribosylation factor-like protein 2